METFPWADEVDCAVTVCDIEGVILYMNEKARATFANRSPTAPLSCPRA